MNKQIYIQTNKIKTEYICGFYAVNKRHCVPYGVDHCVVCKVRESEETV